MRNRSTTTTIDGRALAAASARAERDPGGRLPCPGCAASLKGVNLGRHLQEQHAGSVVAPSFGTRTRLVGEDRRIRDWFGVVASVWLASFAAVVVRTTGPRGVLGVEQDELPATTVLRLLATSPAGSVLLTGLAAAVALAVFVRCAGFRATVTVTPGLLELRYRVGTGTRRVDLPATVETGSLFVRRRQHHSDGTSGPATDEHVGTYLRVAHGRRGITIGCGDGTSVRKHWAGWTGGSRRRRWDVTLPAPSFVALQYALAAQGLLAPPSIGRPAGSSAAR